MLLRHSTSTNLYGHQQDCRGMSTTAFTSSTLKRPMLVLTAGRSTPTTTSLSTLLLVVGGVVLKASTTLYSRRSIPWTISDIIRTPAPLLILRSLSLRLAFRGTPTPALAWSGLWDVTFMATTYPVRSFRANNALRSARPRRDALISRGIITMVVPAGWRRVQLCPATPWLPMTERTLVVTNTKSAIKWMVCGLFIC